MGDPSDRGVYFDEVGKALLDSLLLQQSCLTCPNSRGACPFIQDYHIRILDVDKFNASKVLQVQLCLGFGSVILRSSQGLTRHALPYNRTTAMSSLTRSSP